MLDALEHIGSRPPGEADPGALWSVWTQLTEDERAGYAAAIVSGDAASLALWCIDVDTRLSQP